MQKYIRIRICNERKIYGFGNNRKWNGWKSHRKEYISMNSFWINCVIRCFGCVSVCLSELVWTWWILRNLYFSVCGCICVRYTRDGYKWIRALYFRVFSLCSTSSSSVEMKIFPETLRIVRGCLARARRTQVLPMLPSSRFFFHLPLFLALALRIFACADVDTKKIFTAVGARVCVLCLFEFERVWVWMWIHDINMTISLNIIAYTAMPAMHATGKYEKLFAACLHCERARAKETSHRNFPIVT